MPVTSCDLMASATSYLAVAIGSFNDTSCHNNQTSLSMNCAVHRWSNSVLGSGKFSSLNDRNNVDFKALSLHCSTPQKQIYPDGPGPVGKRKKDCFGLMVTLNLHLFQLAETCEMGCLSFICTVPSEPKELVCYPLRALCMWIMHPWSILQATPWSYPIPIWSGVSYERHLQLFFGAWSAQKEQYYVVTW